MIYVVYTVKGDYVGAQAPTADAAKRYLVRAGITEASTLPIDTFRSPEEARNQLDTTVHLI